jgi:hypothetical protein
MLTKSFLTKSESKEVLDPVKVEVLSDVEVLCEFIVPDNAEGLASVKPCDHAHLQVLVIEKLGRVPDP